MSSDVPQKYVQIYGNYDKSWVRKCRTLLYQTTDRSGKYVSYPIPCVFATPDRAFAQMRQQIARQKGVDVSTIENIPIPLPILSITRLPGEFDPTRFCQHTFRRLYYRPETSTYIGMKRPNPWNMTYQIDVWARTLSDLDDFTVQMNLWLRSNEFFLTVEHPIPMGTRIVRTEFKGMTDNSTLDPKSEDKRVLRRTFSFVVQGWIVPPEEDTPIVQRIIVNFYDSTLSELAPEYLERVVVTAAESSTVVPPLPNENSFGTVSTTMYGLLIVGEASAGQAYGNFSVPANSKLTGMQASVLGNPPTGDVLKLVLTVNGVPDPTRYITVPAGKGVESVTFGATLNVMTGDVLGVQCVNVGSTEAGSWIEIRFLATVQVNV